MKTSADATEKRPTRDAVTTLPRRGSRTRQGRARLLTIDALDSRTAACTAARQLIATLSADLGGEDALSAGERQLVMRAALTGAIAADAETRWLAGQQIELGDYLQAVNVQRRVLATLGLQRRARDVSTPSVEQYVAHLRAQQEATP